MINCYPPLSLFTFTCFGQLGIINTVSSSVGFYWILAPVSGKSEILTFFGNLAKPMA